MKSCCEKGKRRAEQHKTLEYLYFEAREEMERKEGTILSNFKKSALRLQNITVHDTL